MLNQKVNAPSNDFFIKAQEEIIQSKLEMIRFFNKDLAFNLLLKDQTGNTNIHWEIDHINRDIQQHIRHLGESIRQNRRLINARSEELRIRDHIIDRDEGGAGREERTRSEAVKQLALA